MRADLRKRFLAWARRKQLVRPGDRVLAAVSGGVDSMVLLHLLHTCAADLEIELRAAHFDHAMRAGSEEDAAFVAGVCRQWGVPLVAARAGGELRNEAQARDARYAFLFAAQAQTGSSRVATAHHADDQVETILFRLLRGAGLRGLAGIPARRGCIVRPLLRFRKQELMAYAAQERIEFQDDPTNESMQFARNRIRRVLIPLLHTIDGNFSSEILRMARHAAGAERAWRRRIRAARKRAISRRNDTATELARGVLLEYDGPTRARLMRSELRRFGVVPDRGATDALIRFLDEATSGSRLDVGGGVRIERAFDTVRVTRAPLHTAAEQVAIPACAEGAGRARIGGRDWRVVWTTSPTADAGQRFDCAALRFPLLMRPWQPGDRVRLSYGTKKLKKLFAEARVPVHERASVPVVVDAEGRVCWVAGVARSADAPEPADGPALTIVIADAENS